MTIEEFQSIKIAYVRRTGRHGEANKQLMEHFKAYLKANGLFRQDPTLLGIALDDPLRTPENEQRYDVGLVLTGSVQVDLPVRGIADGRYAVFEVAHTAEAISDFWKNLSALTAELPLDEGKPILERYAFPKISADRCEICVPLREC